MGRASSSTTRMSDRWRSLWRRAIVGGEQMLSLLLPPQCAACREPIQACRGELGLCLACRRQLQPPERVCLRCGAPLSAAAVVLGTDSERSAGGSGVGCRHCRTARWAFGRAYCLGVYDGWLAEAVVACKRAAREPLALSLGRQLGGWLVEQPELRADYVVSVPQYWWRRLTRRCNSSQLIAEGCAGRLGVPLRTGWLRAVRPTAKQGTLAYADRPGNVRGAFAARVPRSAYGCTCLLIDDIMTSGSTADQAARALLAAGAGRVEVAVIARGAGSRRSPSPSLPSVTSGRGLAKPTSSPDPV